MGKGGGGGGGGLRFFFFFFFFGQHEKAKRHTVNPTLPSFLAPPSVSRRHRRFRRRLEGDAGNDEGEISHSGGGGGQGEQEGRKPVAERRRRRGRRCWSAGRWWRGGRHGHFAVRVCACAGRWFFAAESGVFCQRRKSSLHKKDVFFWLCRQRWLGDSKESRGRDPTACPSTVPQAGRRESNTRAVNTLSRRLFFRFHPSVLVHAALVGVRVVAAELLQGVDRLLVGLLVGFGGGDLLDLGGGWGVGGG